MAPLRKTRTPAAPAQSRVPGVLKSACILGLIAALGLLGCITLLSSVLAGWRPPFGMVPFGAPPPEDELGRLLADFDHGLSARGVSPQALNRLLDRLEKRALSVESQLSILKRRRNLIRSSLPETADTFKAAYLAAAKRAAASFPSSEPLAALAAEALVLRDGGEGDPQALEGYLSRLSDDRFLPLTVSLAILSGNMADPRKAAALPLGDSRLASVSSLLSGKEWEQFLVNRALLRLLRGDIPGSTALLRSAMAGTGNHPLPETLRFAAEFFYDFDDPLRAAEIFSRLPGEENLVRQADALWLSGRTGAARNIWLALRNTASLPDHALRSFYNLASTTKDPGEKIADLERFFTERQREGSADTGPDLSYGIIAYTRLLDTSRAVGILEAQDRRNDSLMDLELLRRRQEFLSIDRTVAELWLLLDRHGEDGRLYQWGAYYFDRQKRYQETAFLFQTAAFNHIDESWMRLNNAIRHIREGRLDEGELILRNMPIQTGAWQISANIGRVLEARRSYAAALEYYEIAASLVKNNKNAALVQLRIARCLRALDRPAGIRRVLEYAAALDPENLTVRLELRRLEG
jgi:tetratricopeptide (TPR) repeat protein